MVLGSSALFPRHNYIISSRQNLIFALKSRPSSLSVGVYSTNQLHSFHFHPLQLHIYIRSLELDVCFPFLSQSPLLGAPPRIQRGVAECVQANKFTNTATLTQQGIAENNVAIVCQIWILLCRFPYEPNLLTSKWPRANGGSNGEMQIPNESQFKNPSCQD
jgi:hypothetical protein